VVVEPNWILSHGRYISDELLAPLFFGVYQQKTVNFSVLSFAGSWTIDNQPLLGHLPQFVNYLQLILLVAFEGDFFGYFEVLLLALTVKGVKNYGCFLVLEPSDLGVLVELVNFIGFKVPVYILCFERNSKYLASFAAIITKLQSVAVLWLFNKKTETAGGEQEKLLVFILK